VLRLERAPTRAELAELRTEFDDIVVRGDIDVIEATPAEVADDDHVDLARIAFRFDRRGWSRLRAMIDCLNGRPYPR